MERVQYQLKIEGLASPNGTISVRAMINLCSQLTDCAERGLRLAIEGESVKRGKTPAWLDKAVNLTLTGLQPGSTVLTIEAPTLGDSIGDQLVQPDLWFTLPSENDTALSLLTKSVLDTTSGTLESQYYDSGVLSALLRLKPFLKHEASALELRSRERPQENFRLGLPELEKVDA